MTPQQRNPNRVNVHVDGSYAFSLDASLALEAGLRAGSPLPAELLGQLLQRDQVAKAVEAGVRLLTFRPRSEAELRQRLARKCYEEPVVAQALQRLRELGYVDDEEFARFWVHNRDQFKPMGSRRLRSELLQKGLDRDTAQQAIEDRRQQDEDALALTAARARLRSYASYDYPVFQRRLGGYLARQGFDYGTASRVIRRLWAELQGEISDEAE